MLEINIEERNALMERVAPLVKILVSLHFRSRRVPPNIEFDDLWGAANYRVLGRIHTYNPRISSFEVFLSKIVRGAISDFIRFWSNKNRTTKIRPIFESLTVDNNIDPPKKSRSGDVVDNAPDPELMFALTTDMRVFIRKCTNDMPKRHPRILWLRYAEGYEVLEISRLLKISHGRASQMKGEAVKRFGIRANHLKVLSTREFYPRRSW